MLMLKGDGDQTPSKSSEPDCGQITLSSTRFQHWNPPGCTSLHPNCWYSWAHNYCCSFWFRSSGHIWIRLLASRMIWKPMYLKMTMTMTSRMGRGMKDLQDLPVSLRKPIGSSPWSSHSRGFYRTRLASCKSWESFRVLLWRGHLRFFELANKEIDFHQNVLLIVYRPR